MIGYEDDVRIVGGWVPELLYPGGDHIGSVDVDVLLNHNNIVIDSYENIVRLLERNGYYKHANKHFTYCKDVLISETTYIVDVDFLAGKYGGSEGRGSQHLAGIRALKATGGNFAFDFPPEEVVMEGKRTDGAFDIGHVKVISIVPYFVMKTAALSRQKPKDAYDMYFCIQHYDGGIRALTEQFLPYKEYEIIQTMVNTLSEKFKTVDHAGPADIVSFLLIADEDDASRVKRDAYEKFQYLIDALKIS